MDILTVGYLRDRLEGLGDDVKLLFPGGLTFYRLKRWGDDKYIIEFNEPQADLSDKFTKRHPNIKVAFIDTSDAERDESGLISGPIDITI